MGSSGGVSGYTQAQSDARYQQLTQGVPQIPGDRGYIAWTQPTYTLVQGTAMPTAGLLMLRRLRRVPAASVTNIVTYLTAGGSSLTSGQCFAALYRSDATLVATTVDQAAAWATSGAKTMQLSGGPFSLTGGDYYIGAWYNGTTGPTIVRSGTLNANLSNIGLGSGYEAASADTGRTTTAPDPFGAQTPVVYEWWFALN